MSADGGHVIPAKKLKDGSICFEVTMKHLIEQTLLHALKRPEFRKTTVMVQEDETLESTTAVVSASEECGPAAADSASAEAEAAAARVPSVPIKLRMKRTYSSTVQPDVCGVDSPSESRNLCGSSHDLRRSSAHQRYSERALDAARLSNVAASPRCQQAAQLRADGGNLSSAAPQIPATKQHQERELHQSTTAFPFLETHAGKPCLGDGEAALDLSTRSSRPLVTRLLSTASANLAAALPSRGRAPIMRHDIVNFDGTEAPEKVVSNISRLVRKRPDGRPDMHC